MKIAFFGSSLVSSYWNGAATYYRGVARALHALGHRVTFYEPDASNRQRQRDVPDPPWARVVVYSGTDPAAARRAIAEARDADVVVKASYVGVFDELLEAEIAALSGRGPAVVFWDADAPTTVARIERDRSDPLRGLLADYDLVLTYGGGDPAVEAYVALGARRVAPIHDALDPDAHFAVAPDPRFKADLSLLADRHPEREARTDELFFGVARALPDLSFLLGGSGWGDKPMPPNVRFIGHVPAADHNAFNAGARAVLDVAEGRAARGSSPATRVFEAAGAAACVITDATPGIERFLEPDREVLVARSGREVAAIVRELDPDRARAIGAAARRRVLAQHTYAVRAQEIVSLLSLAAGAR